MRHPLLRFTLAFVLGVLLASLGPWAVLGGVAAVAGLSLLIRHRRALLMAAAGVAVGGALAWHAFTSAPPPPEGFRTGPERLLDGTVASPVRRHREGFRAWLGDVLVREGDGWRAIPGLVQLDLPDAPVVRSLGTGQRLRLRARLRPVRPAPNPGVGDPADVLRTRGIVATGRLRQPEALFLVEGDPIPPYRDAVRWEFRAALERATGPPTAALLEAVVLGDGDAPDDALQLAWRTSGLTHLLSISGLHVGIVAWLVYALIRLALASWPAWASRFAPDRPAALLAILASWAYVTVAAGPVPAVRAAWMATGILGARVLGRASDGVSALSMAALVVLAVDPVALGDPSFQLSFAAVVAIGLGAGPVDRFARRIEETWPFPLLARGIGLAIRALGTGVLATLGTLPILAWHFQSIPMAGLLANLVAIPLANWGIVVPGLAALGAVAVGADGLAAPLFWLADLGSRATDGFARWCADLAPPLGIPGRSLWEAVVLTGVAVAGILAFRLAGRRRVALAVSAMLVGVVATARALPSRAPGELRVTFMAVGHGDSTLLQLPNGYTMLIDGGGDPAGQYDVGTRVVVPALTALGVDRIDALVISHAHPDHFRGLLAVVQAFEVGELWTNGPPSPDPLYVALIDGLRRGGVPTRAFAPDSTRFRVGDVTIEALHPLRRARDPPWTYPELGFNDNSLVLRLELGTFSLLMTGDVERAGERLLLDGGRPLASTVLKVPHHGSRTSSTRAFLEAVHPKLAVALAADGGHFPFPDPDVEARYRELGIPLLVTGRHGAIQVTTDGESWDVRTW